jgi:tetratricopeptide (TPR) repeat protein
MTNQEKLLNYARSALNTGDISSARTSLFKIENYQDNHEALYLLAVCHALANDFSKAEELFIKAINLSEPTDALLGNLGLAQLHQKKFREAIDSYLRAVEINPGFYDALVNLSSSYDFLNNNDLAVSYAQKAHRLNQNNPVTLNILAKHAVAKDKLKEAITLYNSSLTMQPDLTQTYAQLSNAYFLAKNYKLAEEILNQGLTRHAGNSDLTNSLGSFYASRNRHEEAIEEFKKVLSRDKRNTFALAALAKSLIALQKFDQASNILLNAYDEFPDSAEIITELSNYYQLHKDYESAYEITTSFIAKMDSGTPIPENIAIAHSNSCKNSERLVEAKSVLSTVISSNTSTHAAMESMHYTYGDVLDGLGDFDAAFSSYKHANELIPRASDIKYYERVLSDLISTLDRSVLDAIPTSGNKTTLPVFIVGMPRSGTSLVEQIISSHPDAHGAGELSHLWDISNSICGAEHMIDYTKSLQKLSREELGKYADNYLNIIKDLSNGEARITDKMPHNFMQLGLIERLFPNATIIHCQRHPFDTCLSIYFRKINENHVYARKLEDLARFYKKYIALMQHWHRVSALQILDVKYENMVTDQKAESEKIIRHIGLDWSDEVLDYHESDRIIMTPSSHQASKPIYTSSMYRWKNYRKHIGPLIEILGQPEQYDQ